MSDYDANELAAQLWRLREMLEGLSFKIEEHRLLAAAGHARWLQRASLEVDAAIEALRPGILATAVLTAAAARAWGVPPTSDLSSVALAAPGVWREILGDHLVETRRAIAELREQSAIAAVAHGRKRGSTGVSLAELESLLGK